MKRKILVTGGAGNIGGALSSALISNPNNYVVVVDNLSTGSISKLPFNILYSNFRFIKGDVNDIKDISQIMMYFKFDYVFHYAAVVGVNRTLENPIKVLKDIQGIENILTLAKNTGVKRVFYSSSSEVYGEPVEFPQNEDTTPLNSRLPYAVVKNVGESFLKSYNKEYGLDYTIFRFFNTYGPGQSEDFVISKFLYLASNNLPITIYGCGDQTRTFCYIDDNVEASVRALDDDLYINDIINIGSDQEISILELANLVVSITGSKSEIKYLPPLPEGDMTRRKPDVSKMKLLIGRDFVSLSDGILKICKVKGI